MKHFLPIERYKSWANKALTADNNAVGLALAAIIFLGSFLTPFIFISFSGGDPDRFYHYAISKMYSLEFLPQTLVQAENIGWNQIFQEKEFLFHVFTGLAYLFGGTHGVDDYARLQFALLMASIFWISAKLSKSWLYGLVISLSIISTAHYFPLRMMFVRPHVLAILFYCWMLWSALSLRFIWLTFFSVLYLLAYHTFYVPVIIFGCYLFASVVTKAKTINHKEIAWFFLALLVAIIINPYFPSNFMLGFTHFRIALQNTSLPLEYFGQELIPQRSDLLFKTYGPYMVLGLTLLILIPGLAAIKRLAILDRKYFGLFLLAPILLLWTAAIMLNPRSSEYLIPTLIFLVSVVITLDKTIAYAALSLTLLCAGVRIPAQYKMFKDSAFKDDNSSQMFTEAIAAIPLKPSEKKVFNCYWSTSPYILNFRPDLRFIDLLDPTFLFNFDQERSNEKWSLVKGELPDAAFHIFNDFKSSYVLCEPNNLSAILIADPEITTLFPIKAEQKHGMFVFKLPETRRDNYARQLNIALSLSNSPVLPNALFKNQISSTPKPLAIESLYEQSFEFLPSFFYLASVAKNLKVDTELDSHSNVCLSATLTDSFIGQHAEAQYLGIGYHGHSEVWLNGKLLFKNYRPSAARLINSFLKLAAPLAEGDNLTLVSCGAKSMSSGLALSLWSEAELQQLCQQKMTKLYGSSEPLSNDIRDLTCGIELIK